MCFFSRHILIGVFLDIDFQDFFYTETSDSDTTLAAQMKSPAVFLVTIVIASASGQCESLGKLCNCVAISVLLFLRTCSESISGYPHVPFECTEILQ